MAISVNLLDFPVELAKNATEIDEIRSWAAYSALAYIRLVKDGGGITEVKQGADADKVKKEVCKNLMGTINRLEKFEIPEIEAAITYIFMTKMLSDKTDLVLQLLGERAIIFEIKSMLERTIDMVSKSSSKEMIELGRFLPLDELAQKINMTAVVLSATNKTGGFRSAAAWSFHDIGKVVNASKEDGLGWPSMHYTLNQMQSMGGFVFELSTRELNEREVRLDCDGTRHWFGAGVDSHWPIDF